MTYEEFLKYNNRNYNNNAPKIRIKKDYKEFRTTFIVFDDYENFCENEESLTDLLNLVTRGEVYINNPGAMAKYLEETIKADNARKKRVEDKYIKKLVKELDTKKENTILKEETEEKEENNYSTEDIEKQLVLETDTNTLKILKEKGYTIRDIAENGLGRTIYQVIDSNNNCKWLVSWQIQKLIS